jgi:hypothetical protein
MNPCTAASDRTCAAQRWGTVFWKDPPWRLMPLAFFVLTPLLSQAQSSYSIDAVSREVSVFNFGQPAYDSEAISREVSIINFGQPAYGSEAVSREVSIINFGQPAYGSEAISREVSVYNFGQPAYGSEAIAREVSVFNEGIYIGDAISREVSLFNYGFNHFTLTVGSTVVLAGTSSNVPVTFSTLAPVTNVQVAVDFPQNLLTNWSVQPQSSLTGTAFVSNNSRLYLTFSPTSRQSISNTQQLGQINFASSSNQPSAFLPLPVASVTAPLLDGTTYTPYKALQNGEVVVLHTNSLLRWSRGTNGLEHLTLYGFSGTNYTIESTTNLNPPTIWQPAYTDVIPAGFVSVTPSLETTNPAMFFRAKQ